MDIYVMEYSKNILAYNKIGCLCLCTTIMYDPINEIMEEDLGVMGIMLR